MLLCVSFLRIHYYDIMITVSTSNAGMIMTMCGNIGIISNVGNIGNVGNIDNVGKVDNV